MRVSARSSCTCFCDSDLAATVIFSHLRMTDRRLKRRSPVRWTVLLSKKIRRTSWTTYAHSPTHICAHTRSCACFKVTFSTAYVHTCAFNHSRTSTSTRSLTPTYTCTWPPQATTTTETNTDKVKWGFYWFSKHQPIFRVSPDYFYLLFHFVGTFYLFFHYVGSFDARFTINSLNG